MLDVGSDRLTFPRSPVLTIAFCCLTTQIRHALHTRSPAAERMSALRSTGGAHCFSAKHFLTGTAISGERTFGGSANGSGRGAGSAAIGPHYTGMELPEVRGTHAGLLPRLRTVPAAQRIGRLTLRLGNRVEILLVPRANRGRKLGELRLPLRTRHEPVVEVINS